MSNFMEKFYPESRFGGFVDSDGTIAFYTRINELVRPENTILDVGCGRGEYQDDMVSIRRNLRVMKGKVGKVIGIDVDEGAANNPFIDEFHQIGSDFLWPVDDGSVDLIISDWTLEHVYDPSSFFKEAFRTLKPNGKICLRTINRWGYVALFSRMIPNSLHARVLPKVQQKREQQDVFPVYYRCNSIPTITGYLKKNGFDGVVYGYEPAPAYLNFSIIAYAVGVLYQGLAPQFFRNTIYVYAEKVH